MDKFIRLIDQLNRLVSKSFCYLIYALIGVVIYEVVARKVFASPTTWAFDMTGYLGSAFFISGLGYCMLHNAHVKIDVIANMLPKNIRDVLNILTMLVFFFPFVLGVFYAGFDYAAKSWITGELGTSSWKPPVYIPKTLIPFGFGLLLLQGVSNFIKLFKKK
ncbi:TRAP transporter small permease subunit [Dethiosulfatarculus sandiegensis]|uniref:Tripartite ATP-independent periplasmic transporters DctQ component domain-containing protein n=1 Tax=Dethiosulfatarculus sandiegensis TaxID=1429043 RepID=A0A0D2HK67_9BACT|nr:TRAP transporter small permease subunit [Dethiosulfatarculus sandiegensis]KIX11013.1 hypothetical protein X474_27130 [Dethiosulfatarculus sandiegensis]